MITKQNQIIAMSTYNRKDDLSKAFNDFWRKALNSKEDFYSKLTLQEFVMLKKAITNINNIVTMLATEGFIHTLRNDGVISSQQEAEMLQQLLATHANTNGFDVEYNKEVKIVAEVKCNIPVNKKSFGAAQESSIMDDVEHLFNSKKKSDLTQKAIKDYYKFMVFLEEKDVQPSAQKLIKKLTNKGFHIKEYAPQITLQKDTVYFIYISTT